MFSLDGKVAIITGSTSGIGKGIASVFAEAGASVVICSRKKKSVDQTVRSLEKDGKDVVGVVCDVSKEKDIKNLVKRAVKKFGKIDIFVNNAGVLMQKPIENMTEKDWDWLMNINLKGVFLGTKHAAIQMKKQGKGGSIINVASIAALRGYAGLSAYCSSKGGIYAFDKAAAVELAPYKIRVNTICPGLIETNMTKWILKDKKMKEYFMSFIPLKFVGQPKDIGYLALYLASDESRYITGAAFVADGGNMLV